MAAPTANQHRAGKKIAAALEEHGVHESAYQVAKNLTAAKAWERSEISLTELCDRAGFDLPEQEADENTAEAEETEAEETEATVYTYRVETRVDETWVQIDTETQPWIRYDGDGQQLAQEVLTNWVNAMLTEGHPGQYRVLVWTGRSTGGSDDTAGWASTVITSAHLPNRGGRPEVGPQVHIRLPQETIQRLDTVAGETGQTRAALIRRLVEDGLA